MKQNRGSRALLPSLPNLGMFFGVGVMVTRPPIGSVDGADPAQQRVRRWQTARTWARLIREAEALWRVDVRALRRLASQELFQLVQEVPPRMRRRVNLWLVRFNVLTRLR